jgi:AcrR family transcriptional regulator
MSVHDQPDSRQRMVISAAVLLRERGLTATSFTDVLQHSGAPRGSIYHHFPGGKAQLVEEAVRLAGELVVGVLERAAAKDDPIAALQAFISSWRDGLKASDFRAGCPVVAVAVEAHEHTSEVAQAAAAAYTAWHDALLRLFRRSGIEGDRAHRLAHMTVAAVEGAIVLCRIHRSTRPLDDVERELIALLRSARGDRASRGTVDL